MNQPDFQERWWNRTLRYPGAYPLPQDRSVHLHIDPEYARTYAGQVAAVTAASLFSRMTASVAVDVPSLGMLSSLPWAGDTLDETVMRIMAEANLHGQHEQRAARREDLRVVIGPSGDGLVVHGAGWGAFRGTGRSPLVNCEEQNPFGPAFSVIAAAAQLQRAPQVECVDPISVDTYHWKAGLPPGGVPQVSPDFRLGELWCIGVGSVGSCALFFLPLVTRSFHAVLIDKDKVEIENVTRSALFSCQDASEQAPKIEVAHRWLQKAGAERIETYFAWLDEIPERWKGRQPGTPDVVLSAANERNVRSTIEAGYPPLQVYATTGRNWQATLFRHIPMVEACSLCVPGNMGPSAPTLCATGTAESVVSDDREDDVALPFLSYAAGLMTVTEVTKLALGGRAVTANRVFFDPGKTNLVTPVTLVRKQECPCRRHDESTYKAVIKGSRFEPLSVNGMSQLSERSL